jgi:hypothetical protein
LWLLRLRERDLECLLLGWGMTQFQTQIEHKNFKSCVFTETPTRTPVCTSNLFAAAEDSNESNDDLSVLHLVDDGKFTEKSQNS